MSLASNGLNNAHSVYKKKMNALAQREEDRQRNLAEFITNMLILCDNGVSFGSLNDPGPSLYARDVKELRSLGYVVQFHVTNPETTVSDNPDTPLWATVSLPKQA